MWNKFFFSPVHFWLIFRVACLPNCPSITNPVCNIAIFLPNFWLTCDNINNTLTKGVCLLRQALRLGILSLRWFLVLWMHPVRLAISYKVGAHICGKICFLFSRISFNKFVCLYIIFRFSAVIFYIEWYVCVCVYARARIYIHTHTLVYY